MTVCSTGRYGYYTVLQLRRNIEKKKSMILASIHILVLQSKQVKLKYYNRKDLSVKEKNFILCESVATINYNINLYVV
jgi:hypothetical protein